MKHDKDNSPLKINQEQKEKSLRELMEKFEDCCYVMLAAIKSYRKTFGIGKEENK